MNTATKILPLVPMPASVRLSGGCFSLGRDTAVSVSGGLSHIKEQLFAVMSGLGDVGGGKSGEVSVFIEKTVAGQETDEAYALVVAPEGVKLRAATEAGLFRGLQTLIQLIEGSAKTGDYTESAGVCSLPCLEIKDAPTFAWRGLMLDVSRHFFTVSEVKAFLDRMARLKLNVFHWHLTDDQGWRIEIKSRPKLTTIGAVRAESSTPEDVNVMDGTPYGPYFYTQDDIREVVAYAKARSILVVPEIDLPGHVRAVLACYPELGCTGGPYEVRTTWGIEEDVLCLGNPASLEFARDVLGEVCELFPGPFVHIGGDEVPTDRWMHCPCCLEAARKAGLESPKGLQKIFTHELEAFLAARGKRAIGWDEILDEDPRADTVVASWRGVKGGIKAAARGNDAIMSPATHCYLDYRESEAPGQVIGRPDGRLITLAKCYSYEPRDPSLTPEQAAHIIGLQGNVWTEYMWSAEDVERMVFPRAHAIAEIGWTPAAKRDFASFSARLALLRPVGETQDLRGAR